MARSPHSWVTGGQRPAFLVCEYCGIEHTMRKYLDIRSGAQFWIREPEGDWVPRLPPTPSCPWRHWVKAVVRGYFRARSPEDDGAERLWHCYGFDPRYGYRLRTRDTAGPERHMNVSPREIHKWQRVAPPG